MVITSASAYHRAAASSVMLPRSVARVGDYGPGPGQIGSAAGVAEVGGAAPWCRRAAARCRTHARRTPNRRPRWSPGRRIRVEVPAPGRRRAPARGTARRRARGRTPRPRWRPPPRTPHRTAATANPVASICLSSRAIRDLVGQSRPPNPGRDHRPASPRHRAAAVVHWSDVHPWRSFSTRRNTLPEGRRGISGTKTIRRGRLYDARRSPTRAMSSSASTGASVRRLQPRPPPLPRRRRRAPRTPHSPSTAGMTVQHGLDLGGRHLETADLDHLLGPVGDVHPAVGVDVADVAGAIPAVQESGSRCPRRAGIRPSPNSTARQSHPTSPAGSGSPGLQ